MSTFAVLDFETTGLSPGLGARPTEIGVVLVEKGKIVDSYHSLMNANVPIPYEVQSITGITNEMIRNAPSVGSVMKVACEFVGNRSLVAHNAAFDCKFWDAELRPLRMQRQQEFICSLLLSRRIFPKAPNHQLSTLIQLLRLPDTGKHHRALADAEATAHLLIRIQHDLIRRFNLLEVSHKLLLAIQKSSRHQLESCINRHRDMKR